MSGSKSAGAVQGRWLDAFGRRHPRLTVTAIIVLTIVVTVVLLYQEDAPAVLYEGF